MTLRHLMSSALVLVLVSLTAPPVLSAHDETLAERLRPIFDAYETIRASLAADRSSDVRQAARRISETGRRAMSHAPEDARVHLRALRLAAGKLARTDTGDLGALRRGFSELSRPLVALMEANPELARGRFLFECPMVEGYGRWIQRSERLENPYMGTRMLTCGRRAELAQRP